GVWVTPPAAASAEVTCDLSGVCFSSFVLFFFNDTATTEIYTLSLHDALPICFCLCCLWLHLVKRLGNAGNHYRSEEHTSELQSLTNLVCRLLLEKKKKRR